jgi:serine/threonine-protein kinase RsbW
MSSGTSIRLDFRSTLDMLDLVQGVGDHVGRMAGLDEDALHWLGVAIRESVINAVRHGNQNDTTKRVHVEFTRLGDEGGAGVSIRVRDEGQGFDPETLPDCCDPENLLKSSGRGIFMMRSFMDELVLRRAAEGGMEVMMIKRAQPQQV